VSLLTDFDAFVTESHRGCGDLGARRPESLYAARAVRTIPDSRLRARLDHYGVPVTYLADASQC
jgi:hypothetical protein